MRTSIECIACFVRQAAEAVGLVVEDSRREELLRLLLKEIAACDWRGSPPVVGQVIHRIIRRELGVDDPYRALKRHLNDKAEELVPVIRETLGRRSDREAALLRVAAAGNLLDAGAKSGIAPQDLHGVLQRLWRLPFRGDARDFFRRTAQARSILYLADNAGEIFFDRLLVEELPRDRVTVAVRGAPTLNDATLEDARRAGLTGLVRVIANGSDAPGTVLADCSAEFREEFERAELIISKGQGNFETLSEEDGRIYFLFTVKCEVVGRKVGAAVGTLLCVPGGGG